MVAAGLAKVSRPASCAPSTCRDRTRSANSVQIRNRSVPVQNRHGRAMTALPLADLQGPTSPDPPPGLSHPILAFRQPPDAVQGEPIPSSLVVPPSFQPGHFAAASGSGVSDPPVELANVGHPVLAMRQTDIVIQAGAALGQTVFEEQVFASRHAQAEASAAWWRQRCADVEAHADSVHGADRAAAESLVE